MSRFGKLLRGVAAAASVAATPAFAAAEDGPVPLPASITELPGLSAGGVVPAAGVGRPRGAPSCVPCQPCQPYQPSQPGAVPPSYLPPVPTPPGMGEPTTNPMTNPMAPPAQPQAPADAADFGDLSAGAGVGPTVGLNGYIENAAPVTMARVRFDSAYGNNRPDRGNFFYAKCGCFRPQPDAIGVPKPEKNIDYQELISSGEVAFSRRMSAFFDIPVRFLNPTVNANASGLGDIGFGGKYAFIYDRNRIVSIMLRFQSPSGSISQGLGNGNWWIEPGLLYLEQLSPVWQLFGEFRFQAPLGVRTNFVGNMLRYGVGTSYVVAQGTWGYVAPVLEAVGWTVLSGQELDPDLLAAVAARGDTIVNAKFGLRIGFGAPQLGSPYPTRSDIYIGYGRALTGEVWYKDMMRLEYRRFF